MNKIKQCPCCGAKAELEKTETPRPNGPPKFGFTFVPLVRTRCSDGCIAGCYFEGEDAEQESIMAWNKRHKGE